MAIPSPPIMKIPNPTAAEMTSNARSTFAVVDKTSLNCAMAFPFALAAEKCLRCYFFLRLAFPRSLRNFALVGTVIS
jgi:hypothetical protein